MVFQITFDGTNGSNPSGAILLDSKYKAVNGTDAMYDQQLPMYIVYDPTIKVDDPTRRSKEENWIVGTQNQAGTQAIDWGACAYLNSLVDETWLRPLKDENTFYTKVTPIKTLAQLTKASSRLERVNIIDVLLSLVGVWR